MKFAVSEIPTYHETVEATGIVPEPIYARCRELTTFRYNLPVRKAMTTPKVGAKPARKRK